MRTPTCLTAATVAAVMKRDDVRGLWPQELGAELAGRFGEAFARCLQAGGCIAPRVVIGHDARLGSYDLAGAFARGVAAAGGHPVPLGLVSTEHVYYMTGRYAQSFAGGAMITASHNPPTYNGIKFVFSGARPLAGADLAWIRDCVIRGLPPTEAHPPLDEFADFAVRTAGIDQLGDRGEAAFPVVVAAGNGVGAHAFAPLAARLERKGFRFAFVDPEPDGAFPNGVPNPLLPAFVDRLRERVRAEGARLGIGFDGDGDRAGFVDGSGAEITASQVLALVAREKLRAAPQGAVVMRNLCGSRLLEDVLGRQQGVELVDTPVGHGKIKLLMRHPAYASRVVLAGEHSGHYFYPEFFSVDSGMLTALYMLRLCAGGGPLAEQLAPWRRRYVWSGERNFTFATAAETQETIEALAQQYHGRGSRCEVRHDPDLGLDRVFVSTEPYARNRLSSADLKMTFATPDRRSGWWFVVRPSGNEPQLRLNVEAWGAAAAAEAAARTTELTAAIRDRGGMPSA